MKIRTLFFSVLIGVAVISIGLNAIILTFLTGKNFQSYIQSNYDDHVEQITGYASQMMLSDSIAIDQMKMELETHLVDPIVGIKIYETNGTQLIEVETSSLNESRGNMASRSRMMGQMMRELDLEQITVEQYPIINDQKTIGFVHISRISNMENTYISVVFKASLIRNSMISIIVAIIITFFVALFFSKKMSNSLKETTELAKTLLMDDPKTVKKSMISEITTLQERLLELRDRLKLRQRSRKTNIDTLVHQARTPLTVLKTHLEALGDGVIELTEPEMNLCLEQVDTITSTLESLSSILDVEDRSIEVRKEQVNISQLLEQIVSGLKVQFEKKEIQLSLYTLPSAVIVTDRYILSQVIYNVLTNAYKYTPSQGKVSVLLRQNDENVEIEIKDNGIGIDVTEADKIFQAYFRSSKVSQIQGEGLGLYLARENINAIGGTITAEKNNDQGSRFSIKVPVK